MKILHSLSLPVVAAGALLMFAALKPTEQYSAHNKAMMEWTTQTVRPTSRVSPQSQLLLGLGGVISVAGLAAYVGLGDEDERPMPSTLGYYPPLNQPLQRNDSSDLNDLPISQLLDDNFESNDESSDVPTNNDYSWVEAMLVQPFTLIYGKQGGGKSSKLGYAVMRAAKENYKIIIVDPHAYAAKWRGLKVYGKGRNYDGSKNIGMPSAEDGIRSFIAEVERRYELIATVEGYDPMKDERRLVLACDEVSNWGDNIDPDLMKELMNLVLAELRKANAAVFFAAHGKTLKFFGGKAAAGTRDAIDALACFVECFSQHVEGTSPPEYEPTGKVMFKTSNDDRPYEVGTPNWLVEPPNYNYQVFVQQAEAEALNAELKQRQSEFL